MRGYTGLAKAAMRQAVAYRLSLFLGLFAVFFQMLATLSIWHVLLRSGRSLAGFDWPTMKAYLVIAFATSAIGSFFGDMQMASRIRDGLVALDLVKPVDYQRARFAETLGRTAIELALIGAVCLGVVALSGGVPLPDGPAQAALFALSLLIVVPLKFVIVYLSTLLCFWTQNYLGVVWARGAVISLLSGALIPLAFLPQWLQSTAAVLPFTSMTATPAMIFLDRTAGADALVAIGFQLGWVLVMWFGARLAWRSAVRQLTVHGG